MEITGGLPAYLEWIAAETAGGVGLSLAARTPACWPPASRRRRPRPAVDPTSCCRSRKRSSCAPRPPGATASRSARCCRRLLPLPPPHGRERGGLRGREAGGPKASRTSMNSSAKSRPTAPRDRRAGRPGSAGVRTLSPCALGCADIGVCYPADTRSGNRRVWGGGDGWRLARALRGVGGAEWPDGSAQPLPLPEEQAFGFEAIADGDAPFIRFTPAGLHLPRPQHVPHRRRRGLVAGALRWPAGTEYEDAYFGRTVVY